MNIKDGASQDVQDKVVKGFWFLVFYAIFIGLTTAGGIAVVIIWNLYRTGTIPDLSGVTSAIGATETLMIVGGLALFGYYITSTFIVATFGEETAESGMDMTEQGVDMAQSVTGGEDTDVEEVVDEVTDEEDESDSDDGSG